MEELHEEMTGKTLKMVREYFLSNREFHLTLYRASGWKNLCIIIEHLLEWLLIFNSTLPDVQYDSNLSNSHHLQIIDAIKVGDAKAVGQIILNNIKGGQEWLFARIREVNNLEV